jgi:hypothetical protein
MTRYAQLVFLHLVGSIGLIVHSGAFRVDALFFMLGWARCRSHKSAQEHVTSNLSFCIWYDLWLMKCIQGVNHRCTIFHAWVAPVRIPDEALHEMFADLVFLHPVGYAGHVVHSGASGPRSVDALFFMLGWDWYGFHKKHTRTRYDELVFLHLVGSEAHVVHSGASGLQNIDALFFMLGWAQCGFHKKCSGIHYDELVFLHPVGYVDHVLHFGASGP